MQAYMGLEKNSESRAVVCDLRRRHRNRRRRKGERLADASCHVLHARHGCPNVEATRLSSFVGSIVLSLTASSLLPLLAPVLVTEPAFFLPHTGNPSRPTQFKMNPAVNNLVISLGAMQGMSPLAHLA